MDGPEVDCADPAGLLVADIATIRGECEEVLLKRELLLHITIGLETFLLVALCTYRVIVSVWRITGVGAIAALVCVFRYFTNITYWHLSRYSSTIFNCVQRVENC